MIEIHLRRGDGTVMIFTAPEARATIGRAPTNDVRIADATVSNQHIVVWREGDGLWVRDLGSANGSFLNGRRLRGPELVRPDDELRLGPVVTLALSAPMPTEPLRQALAVEDCASGTRFALRRGRFRIAAGPDADLQVPTSPEEATTLFISPSGEVWRGTDEDEGPLELGETFRVGKQEFRLVREAFAVADTEVPRERSAEPYEVHATLNGPRGAQATLVAGTATCALYGTHKPVLVYVLARRLLEDRAGGVGADAEGWMPDDEVITGIWGRKGGDNVLYVLLHRVRADLRAAGLDPWCIERKRRYLRLRAGKVALT